MTIKSILAITLLSITAAAQNQTFTREVILQSVDDGKIAVKAYRRSLVVFDDRGQESEQIVEQRGKLKTRSQLKPGQYLVTADHLYKTFRTAEPVITEVEPGTPEMVYATWKHGSTVEVYSQGFTLEQRQAVERAVNSWNTGIVRFRYRGEGQGQVTIKRQRLNRVAALSVMTSVDGTLVLAEIQVDPGVTSADALQSTIAHELGHTLGLQDTTDKGSIMFFKSKGVNKTNGVMVPSASDLLLATQPARQLTN